jgi:transmembrane sensor
MEKYADYHYEDFLTDDQFIDWVLQRDGSTDAFWQEVEKKYPMHSVPMELARQAILKLNATVPTQDTVQDAAEVWEAIRGSVDRNKVSGRTLPLRWAAVGIAASVLVFILILPRLWEQKKEVDYPVSSHRSGGELLTIRNEFSTVLDHYLPDSSLVELKPGSELRYVEGFSGGARQVFLKGDGYFNVRKNPEKPFLVNSRGVIVKVLGTSFTIVDSGDKVSVEVETGKVSVYRNDRRQTHESEEVLLGANEKVEFVQNSSEVKKSIVSEPMPVLTEAELQTFSFVSQPVSQIFDAIEKAYGVEIDYPADVMVDCRLTTSLGRENLFEKLDIICAALNASYQVEGGRIKLKGVKCL